MHIFRATIFTLILLSFYSCSENRVEKDRITYSQGEVYQGQTINNSPNGRGTYTWADGDKYVGFFKDGQINGKGSYYFSNGEKSSGNFVDGILQGQGVYHYSNGDSYEGNFKDDLFHGNGTYYYSNGDKFVGYHELGLREGTGFYYWDDGNQQESIYLNDFEHGESTITLTDGTIYKGNLVDGKGILTNPEDKDDFLENEIYGYE